MPLRRASMQALIQAPIQKKPRARPFLDFQACVGQLGFEFGLGEGGALEMPPVEISIEGPRSFPSVSSATKTPPGQWQRAISKTAILQDDT
jgi:hypothetical protein